MKPEDAAAAVAPTIRIVAGNPTPEELAAVTAVLAKALEEESAEHERQPVHRSAWDRSRASMRGSLNPGPGAWRSFSG